MAWQTIEGVIIEGHQVASGLSPNSPYPEGTIKMQKPFFQQLGLDLSTYFNATLNISIAPHVFKLIKPRYTFPCLEWTDKHPPETFSFSPCRLQYDKSCYGGFIYYPHPETKKRNFQNVSTIEVIAPLITDIAYGSKIIFEYNPEEIEIQLSANNNSVNKTTE